MWDVSPFHLNPSKKIEEREARKMLGCQTTDGIEMSVHIVYNHERSYEGIYVFSTYSRALEWSVNNLDEELIDSLLSSLGLNSLDEIDYYDNNQRKIIADLLIDECYVIEEHFPDDKLVDCPRRLVNKSLISSNKLFDYDEELAASTNL